MLHEKAIPDYSWPLYGMAPRIIRLRRHVTELEQRLTKLELCVREEHVVGGRQEDVIWDDTKESPEFDRRSSDKENINRENTRNLLNDKLNNNFSPKRISSRKNEKLEIKRNSTPNNSPHKNSFVEPLQKHITKVTKTEQNTSQNKRYIISSETEKKSKCGSGDNNIDIKGTITTNSQPPKPSNTCKSLSKKQKNKSNEKLLNSSITAQNTQSKKSQNNSNSESTKLIVTIKNEQMKTKNKRRTRKVVQSYYIDCEQPATDNVFNTTEFKTFLSQRFKVQGKTNNLGNSVNIELNKNKITITTIDVTFSKRYLKYLTKKYLCKRCLRDLIRVVSPSSGPAAADTYQLRYYKFQGQDTDDESPDEGHD